MAVVIGTGSFLLFFSLAINVIALLVPYWWTNPLKLNNGLWGSCACTWRYSSIQSAFESNDQAWFKAVQWLYASGVCLMAFALFLLFVVSCCSEKAYSKVMTSAGALMLIAAMCIAVALIVFGVKGRDDWKLKVNAGMTDYGYDWAFWLGVAGFGVALITAIVFLVQGSRC